MRLSGKLIYNTNKHKKPQVVLHDLRFTFLVREMGLEPTRQRHTHLKRACLPIPALSHILCRLSFSTTDYVIISQQYSFVKGFCKISQKKFLRIENHKNLGFGARKILQILRLYSIIK